MLKIKDFEVMGMNMAIQGMRNPLNSWDKSDSRLCNYACATIDDIPGENVCNYLCGGKAFNGYLKIGEADMKLCKNLIKAGPADRKFMRMIHVQVSILAPLYWWKQCSTYLVATTTNSCSTMHTLHKRDLTLDDFSHEHLFKRSIELLQNLIDEINRNRRIYVKGFKSIPGDNTPDIEPHDKDYWWQMIQLLPDSFNQLKTFDLSYENLYSMYFQRRNHKLDEWHTFCDWIESLPYMKEFIEAVEG